MGSDREARVLGAAESIQIGKDEYKLRPVVAQHLCDLEQEALRHYKRQYLQTFSENADLLGEADAKVLLAAKVEEAARWDLQDLPQKDAYDVSRVPVNRHVRRWVKEDDGEVPESDNAVRAVLANALDSGRITAAQLGKMAGKAPLRGRVRYDQWWVTSSMNGMISFILSSLRQDHPEMTKEDVAGWSFAQIAEASRKVESITSASMGNG